MQLWLCGEEIGAEDSTKKEMDEKVSHLFTEGVAVNSNAYLSKKADKEKADAEKAKAKGQGKEQKKEKKSKEQKAMEEAQEKQNVDESGKERLVWPSPLKYYLLFLTYTCSCSWEIKPSVLCWST